jgi:hypothetical protein
MEYSDIMKVRQGLLLIARNWEMEDEKTKELFGKQCVTPICEREHTWPMVIARLTHGMWGASIERGHVDEKAFFQRVDKSVLAQVDKNGMNLLMHVVDEAKYDCECPLSNKFCSKTPGRGFLTAVLLEQGVDPFHMDNKGRTVLDYFKGGNSLGTVLIEQVYAKARSAPLGTAPHVIIKRAMNSPKYRGVKAFLEIKKWRALRDAYPEICDDDLLQAKLLSEDDYSIGQFEKQRDMTTSLKRKT